MRPSRNWPTQDWEQASDAALENHVQDLVRDNGVTRAVVVIRDGRVIAESYASGHDAASVFFSYSVAKSFTSAIVGMLVGDGKLAVDAPAPVPEWSGVGDPRSHITLTHLLHMSSGLASNENHGDPGSDTATMLFGIGRHDVARHAASHPLAYQPGTYFIYSNSTSNVISGIARRAIGGGPDGYRTFLQTRLFDALGMTSARAGFDRAGTFVGSSLIWATARDFARFGLLHARDGEWDGHRLLPKGWVDYVRTPAPGSAGKYGAHFWLGTYGDAPEIRAQWPTDAFNARGMGGQIISIAPSLDTVVVILGNTQAMAEGEGEALRDRQLGGIYRLLSA